MFETITVDPLLADQVEKELLSLKPNWEYLPLTTDFYTRANADIKQMIDEINFKYGPINDTQKFSDPFYNHNNGQFKNKTFIEIRSNPKSRYNVDFPNMAKLLDHLQSTYIPPDYKVVRLMANMQTIRPKWSMNAPHPDFRNQNYITILYYVNTSDGDTYFFNGSECVRRISPVKGTAAMYPSNMFHAGSTPTATETRVVINMCFAPK